MQPSVLTKIFRVLQRQKYHLVGGHSAAKRCRWLYESIVHDRPCYKEKFYGIRSHRCLQMTPSVLHCTMRCSFCWRAQSGDSELHWEESRFPTWDEPEDIIEGCIREQRRIMTGYKANTQANQQKYLEALKPKHAAISLTGEPTLYPHLDGLIRGFHKRGFTTFLVSNGTNPKAFSSLTKEPTQLYISVSAYNQKTFNQVCRPQVPDAWKKLNETLAMLPSFTCPTVIRLTLARHLNLKQPEHYARLVGKANPAFVETKAYMHVGFSRLRMGYNNMPTHKEIRDFATDLAEEVGYNILDEAKESRVVLLSRLEKPIKHA